jgi:hypothetical protein
MRSYPRNSPEAAGRIVALVLMADGNVCRSEIETIERLRGAESLGLPTGGFGPLLQTLCEDLLDGICTTGSVRACLDDATLAALFREVDSPALQREVLRLVEALAGADRHDAEGESFVIDAARRHWRLPAEAEAALER